MAEQELDIVAREAIDTGKAEIFSEIDNSLRPDEAAVKEAAQNLINYALSLQSKYGLSIADQMSTLNTENESAILNFSKKYVKEKAEYQELMKKVFTFQNLVNEFLGQRIIMTFVSISPTTGKVTLYNTDNSIADLSVDVAAASRGGHITGRMTSLEKIKQASKDIINTSYDEQGKQSLDRTFQEVWQRYRISKNKVKLGGAAYILWYLGTWDGVWVSGAGPLGEAYVAFFLNNYMFSHMIEPSVKDFMLNEQYGSIKADNASGFLKGDIVKGAAQFGVKVRGAQPLGYMEVIAYAQEMLKSTDITQYLKNLQNKLENEGVNNMVKQLSNVLELEEKGLLEAMENRVNSIGSEFSSNGVSVAKLRRTK